MVWSISAIDREYARSVFRVRVDYGCLVTVAVAVRCNKWSHGVDVDLLAHACDGTGERKFCIFLALADGAASADEVLE